MLAGISSDTDDVYELCPPTALRVAMRALVLASCACRGSLEEAPQHPIARRTWTDLQDWVDAIGIRGEFESYELEVITLPLGELSERQRIDVSWRSEGMAVLGWALQRCELPPYDVQVDGPAVGDALGFLMQDANGLLAKPMLRPAVELEQLADSLLTVHWRLRQQSLSTEPIDLVAFARSCRWANMRLEDLRLLDGDLSVRGIVVTQADEQLRSECSSIARERQQAANWLVGTESTYSDVTCDT